VTVLTSSRGLPLGKYDYWLEQVGHVVRYPERFTFLEAPVVPQIPLRLLADGNYDVIHIHGMTPTQTDLALLIAKTLESKVIYTHHFDPQTRGGHLTKMYNLLGRSVVGFADVITASSVSYAESSSILNPLLAKVRIIPMGVDPAKFENVKATFVSEDDMGFESFDLRVLYVGKLIYYKGLEYLLKAFSTVKASNSCLVIVGEGRERLNLTRLAHELGISDRVFFLGRQPDWKIPMIYAMSNVVTLPSMTRREAFGIVLLEAMASGKPVIASNIPGVSEVVQEGKTGHLVPPSNYRALAQTLQSLLEDTKTASRMGEAGRILAKNSYSWDKITGDFLQLYAHDGELGLHR
jgi:glycosyltransferase involved in cell wall biosynthesis